MLTNYKTTKRTLVLALFCLFWGMGNAQNFDINPKVLCNAEAFTLSLDNLDDSSCPSNNLELLWQRLEPNGWSTKGTTDENEPMLTDIGTQGDNTFWRVRVEDNNGDVCYISDSIEVMVEIPHSISIDSPTNFSDFCGATSVDIQSTLTGGATSVTWSSNVGGTFDPANSEDTEFTPPEGVFGQMTLTVTTVGIGGCMVASDVLIITIDQPATGWITTMPTSVCGNSNIQLNGTRGGSASSQVWTADVSGGDFSPSAQALNPTYDPPNNHSGPITFTLTISPPVGNECENITDDVTIQVDRVPLINPSANTDELCEGETFSLSANATASTIGSLTWFSSDGGLTSPSSASTMFTPNTTGDLQVSLTATSVLGICPAVTETVDLEVDEEPFVEITSPESFPIPEVCQGETITIVSEIDGTVAGVTWSASQPGGSFSSNALTTNYMPPNDFTGNILLTVTTNTPEPCDPASASITIAVNEGTTALADVNGAMNVCQGGDFDLLGTIQSGDGTLDEWVAEPEEAGDFSNKNSVAPTFTPDPNFFGSIEVYYTIEGDTCSSGIVTSNMLTLTVFQAPTLSISVLNAMQCEDNDFELMANPGGSVLTGTWSSNVEEDDFSDVNALNPDYTAPDGYVGEIQLTFTTDIPSGPCSEIEETITITVLPEPLADILIEEVSVTAPGDGDICFGDAVILTVAGSGNSTCEWSNDGGLTNPNACSWNLDNLAVTTNFSVTVTNSDGCTEVNTIEIEVSPDPDLGIEVSSPCVGEDFGLTATTAVSGNYDYRWEKDNATISNSATYNKNGVTEDDSGVYLLEVTDSEGCVWSMSQMISIDPIPDPVLETTYESVCQNAQAYYKVENITPNSNFIWEITPALAPEDTTTIDGILFVHWPEAGTYTLKVIEFFGDNPNTVCRDEASLTVTVSTDTAPNVAPILHYELNNLLIVKDPDAACYRWGYYDADNRTMVSLPEETFQSYAASEAFVADRRYWVETSSNADCSCGTVSFRTERAEPEVESPIEEKFVLYPNPNLGNFQLEINLLPKPTYELMIVDLLGRVVEQRQVSTSDGELNESFELSDRLPNGLYTLILFDELDIYKTAKFVVLH